MERFSESFDAKVNRILEQGLETPKTQVVNTSSVQQRVSSQQQVLQSQFQQTETKWNDTVKKRFYDEFHTPLMQAFAELSTELESAHRYFEQSKKDIENLK